jgi:hypothetical protein
MALGDVIGRLSVQLGLDTAAFEKGAVKAGKNVDQLGDRMERAGQRVGGAVKTIAAAGAGIAAGFLVSELKGAVTQGLAYASALGETAQQLGVTTKTLQEYRYAATQVGLSQDEMDKSLAKLTRTMGEAADGAKAPRQAFADLGIDIDAFVKSGKDAGDLLPLIAQGLEKIPTPAEKAAKLVDLFGKSGQNLAPLLGEGAKGINNLREAARSLGVVISDRQIQTADETADKLAALQTVLSARIAGAVAENADAILSLSNALVTLIGKLGEAFRAWRLFNDVVSKGKSFRQAAADDLGPGVQLTFTPAELERRRNERAFSGAGASRGPVRSAPRTIADPFRNLKPPPLLAKFAGDGNANPFGAAGRGDFASVFTVPESMRRVTEAVETTSRDIAPALARTARQFSGFADAADRSAGNVGESFKTMADATLASLDRLAGAIKGGGFLGILEGVIGLGIQLGSAGVFGKSTAKRINGYATGTMSAARGLALVGERGPELVKFNGGERVFPNGTGPSGGRTVVEIVDTTGLFVTRVNGQIMQTAPAVMSGGADVALRRSARAQSRRLP